VFSTDEVLQQISEGDKIVTLGVNRVSKPKSEHGERIRMTKENGNTHKITKLAIPQGVTIIV
jgi:hypothetical protein